MGVLANIFMTGGAASGGGWSLNNLIANMKYNIGFWGRMIIVAAGLILVVISIVKIVKGFAQGERGQTNWFMTILGLLVGGILALGGGWNMLTHLSIGTETTLDEAGNSTNYGTMNDAVKRYDANNTGGVDNTNTIILVDSLLH